MYCNMVREPGSMLMDLRSGVGRTVHGDTQTAGYTEYGSCTRL